MRKKILLYIIAGRDSKVWTRVEMVVRVPLPSKQEN